MSQKLSKTKRAISAREWRVGYREKRRFKTFLNEYIEAKHNDIYKQCYEFYDLLKRMHPGRNDLTKIREFKRWKKHQQEAMNETLEDPIETGSPTQQQPLEDPVETGSPTQQQPLEDPVETGSSTQQPLEGPSQIDLPQQDILTVAAGEILQENEIPEINVDDVDRIIENIIHDLNAIMQDDELVQPHYVEEDEGIGLNVNTELEGIIEPFDYALEVEVFDF